MLVPILLAASPLAATLSHPVNTALMAPVFIREADMQRLLDSEEAFADDFDGLRDSGKCLGFALVALGVVRRESKWYALGLFVLVTLTSYCFALALILLVGWCLFANSGEPASTRLKGALLPVCAFVLAGALVTLLTHSFTGHWLPSTHYIKLLGRWL